VGATFLAGGPMRRRAWSFVVVLLLTLGAACDAAPVRTAPNDASASSSAAPIEGRFDVRGHRLFARCEGTGTPTVVLLHGVGGQSADWTATLHQLPGVPTCNYDRLNVGRSDRDPGRHKAVDSVKDLHVLLDVAGVEPPYLLVGHSVGGMLALMYAGLHPDEVAGILLVDATLPLEAELDPPELAGQIAADLDANDEHLDWYDAFRQVGAVLDRLPPVPITYMYGALQTLPSEWEAGAYEKALHEFIDSLPEGRLVEEQSGHEMPIEIPGEIANQVREMLDAIRS
jgi:pimeloyl-ACP methyl ester carboxylesterase